MDNTTRGIIATDDTGNRYGALFRSMPDTIFAVDRSLRVTGFKSGDVLSQSTGGQHVVGTNFMSVMPADISNILAVGINEVIAGRKEYAFEYPVPALERFEEVRIVPFGDSEVLAIVRDITDRKRADQSAGERLRKSEANLTKAQNVARLGNFSIDLRQEKFEGSDELYRIFGYDSDRDSFDFNKFMSIIHPDDVESFMKKLRSSSEIHTSMTADMRIIREDGTILTLHTDSEFIFDESDIPVRIFGIVQDITERKRTEDALRESKAQFSVLAATAPCPISIVQDGKIIYASPAAAELIGYTLPEIIGKSYLALVHRDSYDTAINQLYNRIWSGEAPSACEIKFSHKNGSERWGEVYVGIIDYDGRMATIVTVFDITPYKQAEEKIRVSLKEKELMLKEIHHRVKNNMQIISSLLSLQAYHLNKDDPLTAFKNSQNRVRSMAIVHEMLYQSEDLASIHFGTYINKLLLNQYMSYQVDKSKIKINVDHNQVMLDIEKAVPCGLIINELISNAFKHAFSGKESGTVNITLRKASDQGTCTLVVSDDGIGLPAEIDMNNIQTLGLQLVDMLITQLDGRLTIDRTRGTEFTAVFKL